MDIQKQTIRQFYVSEEGCVISVKMRLCKCVNRKSNFNEPQ